MVNKELITIHSDIVKIIVQRQERFGWDKSIVISLSKELQRGIEGLSRFSPSNLRNMRQYHLAYKDNKKLQTLSTEISWSHNVLIFQTMQKDIFIFLSPENSSKWAGKMFDFLEIDTKTIPKIKATKQKS